jgi:hypothetical protein
MMWNRKASDARRQTPDVRLKSPVNTVFPAHGPDQAVEHLTDIPAATIEPFPTARLQVTHVPGEQKLTFNFADGATSHLQEP